MIKQAGSHDQTITEEMHACGSASGSTLLASAADASSAKSNIIFIILEDPWYRNLGCYGDSSKNGDE